MMATADVAQLNLVPLTEIDFANYKDGGTGMSYAPPPEGKYVGKVGVIDDACFGATKAGLLKVTLPEVELITSGLGQGYKIRFTSLSSKKYSNREGSQMMDFLRACGIAAKPKTNEELIAATKMASGRTFQFVLIWEAYNKDTQETTSGQENFPFLADGITRQSFIVDPYDSTKKWYANGKIKYTISAVGSNG